MNTLIIGSAGKLHKSAITLDIDSNHNPDVVHDLHDLPLPFNTNQFKKIYCHHVLEHLNDINVLNDLHRICDRDGIIYIEVPHHSSWMANTPQHKLRFNYFAFDPHVKDSGTNWMTGPKFKYINRQITFHKRFRMFGFHNLFNKFPVSYERFYTYIFPAEHLKVWLQPVK